MSRKLNVVLAPGSAAHRAVKPPTPRPSGEAGSAGLAPGFRPQPGWNMTPGRGPTIADLVFVNSYVGEAGAWAEDDRANIDRALDAALSDAALQSVIAQYYEGPITSTMLPSALHEAPLPGVVYKDTAEALAVKLYAEGALGDANPASSVINIMLPQGIVLSDDFSPGFKAPAGAEETSERRRKATIKIDPEDAASSQHGLGGYHGSTHSGGGSQPQGGSHHGGHHRGGAEFYYAVGVYSEGENGIVAFDEPWKNVVATFYHELNEARTDPDVEDVVATNNEELLGWYSQAGEGEIGDLPINACGGDLSLVFKEVALADGSGSVPIQLMWSNQAGGPAAKM
ncbi:MAG TPA: hypothetical protein VK672_05905 [Solirubrobacteraceae bacterium]|jgi:hypothetical protein|nr:hypothetical protein [Solirubrobacteraceae bacterium]